MALMANLVSFISLLTFPFSYMILKQISGIIKNHLLKCTSYYILLKVH